LDIDVNEVRRKLDRLEPGKRPQDPTRLIDELLQTDLPNLERTLREIHERFKNAPPQPPASTQQARPPMPPIVAAMMRGSERYTDIRAPALAVYALEAVGGSEGSARKAVEARNQMKRDQAAAFQAGVPSARVVLLENASHDVFQSNESEILREMNEFIKSLPKPSHPKT
jgi:alpha-beta hydrolase superfamily lysophospholipase